MKFRLRGAFSRALQRRLRNKPITVQFSVIFGLLSTRALVLIGIISIVTTVIVGSLFRSSAEMFLREQVTANMVLHLGTMASLVDQRLDGMTRGIVLPVAAALDIIVQARIPYPFVSDPPIFHSDVGPPDMAITSTSLSFSVPGVSDAMAVASGANDTAAFVADIGDTMKEVIDTRSDAAVVYCGVEEDGVFVRFPGLHFTDNGTYSYDPRTRDWYIAARDSNSGPIITAPYVDRFGAGFVITVARAVYDDGTFYGVCGADVVVTELQSAVLDVTFGGGRAYLVLDNGSSFGVSGPSDSRSVNVIIVAHDDFSGDANVPPRLFRESATGDALSPALEDDIVEGDVVDLFSGNEVVVLEIQNRDDEGWFYGSAFVSGTRYRVVLRVPEETVTEIVENLSDEIQTRITSVVTAVVVTNVLVGLLVVLSVAAFARSIARRLCHVSTACIAGECQCCGIILGQGCNIPAVGQQWSKP